MIKMAYFWAEADLRAVVSELLSETEELETNSASLFKSTLQSSSLTPDMIAITTSPPNQSCKNKKTEQKSEQTKPSQIPKSLTKSIPISIPVTKLQAFLRFPQFLSTQTPLNESSF